VPVAGYIYKYIYIYIHNKIHLHQSTSSLQWITMTTATTKDLQRKSGTIIWIWFSVQHAFPLTPVLHILMQLK